MTAAGLSLQTGGDYTPAAAPPPSPAGSKPP
jgi:hypothetical protein